MHIRKLGLVDYQSTWQAMKDFTDQRDASTEDELWLVQHAAVFTQGQAGKAEHVLAPGAIPVIQVDRGGQVTYHGPGQWLVYLLVDIRRHNLGIRDLVDLIEQSIVTVLAQLGIASAPRPDAPGVYVDGQKIASLGLRVRRGCSYHGLALNVDMDLEPFSRINPCGHEGMQVTSVRQLLGETAVVDSDAIADALLAELAAGLGSSTAAGSASAGSASAGSTIS
jgi:lipoyl(octanoyl) transferase